RYLVREIPLPVVAPVAGTTADVEPEALLLSRAVAEYLRLPAKAVTDVRIVRKSLDARARNRPLWRYAVEFSSARSLNHPRVTIVGTRGNEGGSLSLSKGPAALVRHGLPGENVAIVGSGPAGLAAA